MYIVIEGIDCSGKDTLTAQLTQRLKELGHEVVSVREPSDHSEHCRGIRQTLEFSKGLTDSHRYRLLMDARACLLRERVAPVMGTGKVILSNRSFISTLAYQQTLDPEDVFTENKVLLNQYGTIPALVVFLDIPHDVYLKRNQLRNEAKSTLERWIDKKENFDAVRERYLDVMYNKTLFRKLGGSKNITLLTLNGENAIETSVNDILHHLC